jgi:hypothetical protein
MVPICRVNIPDFWCFNDELNGDFIGISWDLIGIYDFL